MKISNIACNTNFGKTVRVNMSTQDAIKLVYCINTKRANRDTLQLKRDAKTIFDDTDKGSAIFCSPDEGRSYYILSGEEANSLRELKNSVLNLQEGIASFYEDGPFADNNIDYICRKERRLVNNLISSTKEPYILTLFNDQETGLPRLHKLSIVG